MLVVNKGGISMTQFTHIDQLMKQYVEKNVAGCGCIVTHKGKIIYENYTGYADIDTKTLLDEHSIHRMYSLTKVVVCTVGMMLFERGYFLLNEPVSKYLPEFSDMSVASYNFKGEPYIEKAKNPMLIKHLFEMSSGVPSSFGEGVVPKALTNEIAQLVQENATYSLRELVKALAQAPLLFEPGTGWAYGFSHDILAALLEVVSGKSLKALLYDELFEPLQMHDTNYQFESEEQRKRMTSIYQDMGQEKLVSVKARGDENYEPDSVYCGGGTGLFSTLRDYSKFAQMLACGGLYEGKQLIGRKTIDLTRTNRLNKKQLSVFQNQYTAGYGYGLGVRTLIDLAESHGNGSVGEFGWTGMSGAYALMDPSEQLSIVYAHQRLPNLEYEHHLRIRNAVYGCI